MGTTPGMKNVFVFAALSAALLASATGAGLAGAAPPVVNGHDHFVSDPYPDMICGVAGTSVDTVVAHFVERADGSTLDAINVSTVFTSTATGKAIVISSTGARRGGAPTDNGDGTFSIVTSNRGQSPKFQIVNGPVLGVDVGNVAFRLTFDSATGEWLGFQDGFEVLKEAGQRPVVGCDAIVAALT
jgi:hypothetical protein